LGGGGLKKSVRQDITKLNDIIESLTTIRQALGQYKITTHEHLAENKVARAACTQLITNVYEAVNHERHGLRDTTVKRLTKLGSVSLERTRNIASHDYLSVNFSVVYYLCVKITKSDVLAEVYGVLSEVERELAEGGDD
jgi:uncharacterized protein with HEPN domain